MKKSLPFDRDLLIKIRENIPTPFYVYDEKEIRRRVKSLYDAFSWNEGFREYYAVKACPNPAILRILTEEGCGLDCSSYTELMLAENVGVTGEDILFTSNATPAEDFIYARRLSSIINLDDITHIDFLHKHGGIPELVSCRYNPGGEFKINGAIMGNPGESKYGFTLSQLKTGFRRLLELGARRFGLHAFLASNMTDNDYYPTLARLLFQTARGLREETGVNIEFIDLSGGLGIPYRPDEKEIDLPYIGREVKRVYNEVFGPTGMKPRIFTELGRYITGPCGYLVTTALHHKETYKHYIGLDASSVNLMRPAMYGAYHHITVAGKEHWPLDHLYDVTGSLCENSDKFAIDRLLPKVDPGDILVLHDAGAHGFSMGYNYNGKLRSAEVMLMEDGTVKLIRRAETPADYFATLDFMEPFCRCSLR